MEKRGLLLVLFMSARFPHGSSLSLRQYHFVQNPKNWTDARGHCREKYTDLATVHNVEDMNNVMKVVDTKESGVSVWIGLGKGGPNLWHWTFEDTQGSRGTLLWGPGAFTQFGDCVAMQTNGKGQNYYCDAQYPFVCINGTASTEGNLVLVSKSKTWEDARSYCWQNYTDLANVIDLAAQSAVMVAANKHYVWVGMFRDQWAWSDSSNSSFRNWFPGSLEHGNGCVRAVKELGGKWIDSPCSGNLPFVCHGAPQVKVIPIKMKMTSDLDLTSKEVSDQVLQQLSQVLANLGLTGLKFHWSSQPLSSRPVTSS